MRAAHRSSEAYLLDRHGELIQISRSDFQQRRLDWVPLEAISPALLDTLLLAEDRQFYSHGGVDWSAMAGALRDSTLGERRGASTLTMQLAGLLDPALRTGSGGRSLGQKFGQMRAAWRIEAGWQKSQILEAYLNLATFRGEQQGVDAAARLLLGRAPHALDRRDSLLLVSLLPAPNASARQVGERACRLAARIADAPTCPVLRAYIDAVLTTPRQPPPTPALAPELPVLLKPVAGQRLQTSLDASLQRLVRTVLREQIGALTGRNVRDGAAVVLDNQSGEVLAWVGRRDDGGSARFVDAVMAPRQAGSTLKPLLYGQAIERRLLTAASLLDDSPLSIDTGAGAYTPQNYDHLFRGPVSVRRALASSLNIPAVRTAQLLGLEPFRQQLQAFGLNLPAPAAHYGYGLALGAAEVSLIDLANAYRALARAGHWSPYRLTPGAALAGRTVLSPQASWIVADMLADRAARAPAFGLDNPLGVPGWAAVKTGTSKDMRDNWAVGFSERHTVAVWIGNADGEPMWDVSGVSGAAPAWHSIMTALLASGPSAPPAPPPGLSERTVQFVPALEPSRREWFIAGTELEQVELAAALHGPAIVYPTHGTMLALDPDIPAERQRVVFRASGIAARWRLDGQLLTAPAGPYFWAPTPGRHVLALCDASGRELARVAFEVRGRPA
ncbi:penicillin-binding protein 1C [Chitinimonas lacunae]|uniref:peptidoglycan glycosyltransferase n=1 Tax=Chitinimonas lacunae TaxID=1963018 RepID=A0ABV8MTU2_9NEIS